MSDEPRQVVPVVEPWRVWLQRGTDALRAADYAAAADAFAQAFAFAPDGVQKEKCMMGPKADCDRCGCVVPFYLASLTDRSRILGDLKDELSHAARRVAKGLFTAVPG